jgi:1-deoxyxylulose-5-phosphate synthase
VRVVSLGRTSIEISEFIFGAGGIGGVGSSPATRGQGITHDQGLERLDEARALGITVIDTADAYAGGASEQAVGEWHRTRQPKHVLLQSKVGGGVTDSADRRANLSREHIDRQLARSIQRLGRVDLYLSHVPDPQTPLAETLEAFAAARDAGLIRAFGMSNVDAALLEQLLLTADRTGLPRPERIQNGLNLLNRSDEKDLLPLLNSEGIGYTPFSALAGGVLSDRYLDGAGVELGSRIAVAGSLLPRHVHRGQPGPCGSAPRLRARPRPERRRDGTGLAPSASGGHRPDHLAQPARPVAGRPRGAQPGPQPGRLRPDRGHFQLVSTCSASSWTALRPGAARGGPRPTSSRHRPARSPNRLWPEPSYPVCMVVTSQFR